ncbi:hypothetical protein D3C73_1083350 [compost metagenome]
MAPCPAGPGILVAYFQPVPGRDGVVQPVPASVYRMRRTIVRHPHHGVASRLDVLCWQGSLYLGEQGSRRVGHPLAGQHCHQIHPGDEGFQFGCTQLQGRHLETFTQSITQPGFTVNRDTRQGEIVHIAVDGALRDTQTRRQLAGGQELVSPQQVGQLEQSIRFSHGHPQASGTWRAW